MIIKIPLKAIPLKAIAYSEFLLPFEMLFIEITIFIIDRIFEVLGLLSIRTFLPIMLTVRKTSSVSETVVLKSKIAFSHCRSFGIYVCFSTYNFIHKGN